MLQLWKGRPHGPGLQPRPRAEVLLLRWLRTHPEVLREGQMLQVKARVKGSKLMTTDKLTSTGKIRS